MVRFLSSEAGTRRFRCWVPRSCIKCLEGPNLIIFALWGTFSARLNALPPEIESIESIQHGRKRELSTGCFTIYLLCFPHTHPERSPPSIHPPPPTLATCAALLLRSEAPVAGAGEDLASLLAAADPQQPLPLHQHAT